MRKSFFYEGRLLYWIDGNEKAHFPKARSGHVSSERCEDCELRDALTFMGLPKYCGNCKSRRQKSKARCVIEGCANGCEVCGGTGRVYS